MPKHRFSQGYSLVLGFSLCLALSACSGSATAEKAAENPGSPAHQSERLTANQLIELKPKKRCFKVVQGKAAGKCVPMTIIAPKRFQDTWQLAFEGFFRLYFRQTANGAVRVSRMEMLKKDRRILFKPAFVMIPELFVPGREIHSTGRATIEAMKTRETVNSGKYRYEIKAPSHTAIDTPAGAREGYLLAYEFQIDLDYSHLRLNLETGWSKNRELVYWRT